ncbi:hypothetical protein SAMN06265348_110149 [Pedobacter westerhofensis]|uniref:Uncharacterized protein n=1 Tax=Pedobacter westerhofensis TaxID=425512 RepID=A0A521F4Z8_9SPHI|nr:hypothetical protein SAMN06265348_110149 [Pedobacter westerhofensis]
MKRFTLILLATLAGMIQVKLIHYDVFREKASATMLLEESSYLISYYIFRFLS